MTFPKGMCDGHQIGLLDFHVSFKSFIMPRIKLFMVSPFSIDSPVLASFLLKLSFSEPIPADVCSLVAELCELLLFPFQSTVSQSCPPPPSDNKLAYFPNLPKFRAHRPTQQISDQPILHQKIKMPAVSTRPATQRSLLAFSPSIAPMEFAVDLK